MKVAASGPDTTTPRSQTLWSTDRPLLAKKLHFEDPGAARLLWRCPDCSPLTLGSILKDELHVVNPAVEVFALDVLFFLELIK